MFVIAIFHVTVIGIALIRQVPWWESEILHIQGPSTLETAILV